MIKKIFKTKIKSIQPIVDIEISNDISNPNGGDWFYSESDIITFGIIEKDKVIIIQREKNDSKDNFIEEIKKILPTKFYSFNWRMEKEGLFGFTGNNYIVEEIKPFKSKGYNKDKFYEEVESIIKPIDTIKDPLNGDSSLVQSRFVDGIYEDIILHNLSCLLKEAYILKFKPAILKKYGDKINSQGWYTG